MITQNAGINYIKYEPYEITNSDLNLFKEQPINSNYTHKQWSFVYYQHARKSGDTSLYKLNGLCSLNTSKPKLVCKGLTSDAFATKTFIE